MAPYCHFCYIIAFDRMQYFRLDPCRKHWYGKRQKNVSCGCSGRNITGGLLTWTKGGGQVFEDGYELKKEENAYEEKFMVSVEGEETGSVYVQIPEKELEKEDTGQPEVLTKEEDEEQKLLEFVANYNSELEDSEYYYLPSDWEGRKLGVENTL